jgi:hypothetical protein
MDGKFKYLLPLLPPHYFSVLISSISSVAVCEPLSHKSAHALRQPKLRKKKAGKYTYWYIEANGDAYGGTVVRCLSRTPNIILANPSSGSKRR